eukprot:6208589-Pleurochrysis_carterae.AAC.1
MTYKLKEILGQSSAYVPGNINYLLSAFLQCLGTLMVDVLFRKATHSNSSSSTPAVGGSCLHVHYSYMLVFNRKVRNIHIERSSAQRRDVANFDRVLFAPAMAASCDDVQFALAVRASLFEWEVVAEALGGTADECRARWTRFEQQEIQPLQKVSAPFHSEMHHITTSCQARRILPYLTISRHVSPDFSAERFSQEFRFLRLHDIQQVLSTTLVTSQAVQDADVACAPQHQPSTFNVLNDSLGDQLSEIFSQVRSSLPTMSRERMPPEAPREAWGGEPEGTAVVSGLDHDMDVGVNGGIEVQRSGLLPSDRVDHGCLVAGNGAPSVPSSLDTGAAVQSAAAPALGGLAGRGRGRVHAQVTEDREGEIE